MGKIYEQKKKETKEFHEFIKNVEQFLISTF